jgi:hypothetical protein
MTSQKYVSQGNCSNRPTRVSPDRAAGHGSSSVGWAAELSQGAASDLLEGDSGGGSCTTMDVPLIMGAKVKRLIPRAILISGLLATMMAPQVARAGTGLNCNILDLSYWQTGQHENGNSSLDRRGVASDMILRASPLCTDVSGNGTDAESDGYVTIYSAGGDFIRVGYSHLNTLNSGLPCIYWLFGDSNTGSVKCSGVAVGDVHTLEIDERPVGSDYYGHIIVDGVDKATDPNNYWGSWAHSFPALFNATNYYQSDLMGTSSDRSSFGNLQERTFGGTWNAINLNDSAWASVNQTFCKDGSGSYGKQTQVSSVHQQVWNNTDAPHSNC